MSQENLPSDSDLLRKYREDGDMGVLADLYGRYTTLVYGVCMKYLKNPTDSEDGVMDIFELLIAKCRQHEIENFRPWLYSTVRNHCLQILRKNLTKDSAEQLVQIGDLSHREDRILIERREIELRTCLETLGEDQRQAIELFYFESCSYAEISEQMKVDKERVRSFIQNGRRNLRICMLKHRND